MVNNVEQRVYEFVRPYAGTYLFKFKKVELTPETDLDTDLSLDELEAGELMDKFFDAFKVERGKFKIETYYPDQPVSWNPFKKTDPVPVPDFNVGMLIESAKAGRWLYE
ncbi:DUF1493 family protein [Enterobacter hormaechei]|uniref:DUF1493 family protein n=1 Tax=Enterobacter hormaechei TaxID=158836 RepID=UPI0007ABAFCE|nr:DUF1493 family protein [Enterobacter hormaechei]MBA7868507.1 DUF1493 family protein [Enterobacter hormaechei]MCM7509232.1 DUF1493 family protein [Enterobacter hormaechei]MCW4739923.1 DUF1493 family protein [Enterobacter hormaechei subsp. hoffmannii]